MGTLAARPGGPIRVTNTAACAAEGRELVGRFSGPVGAVAGVGGSAHQLRKRRTLVVEHEPLLAKGQDPTVLAVAGQAIDPCSKGGEENEDDVPDHDPRIVAPQNGVKGRKAPRSEAHSLGRLVFGPNGVSIAPPARPPRSNRRPVPRLQSPTCPPPRWAPESAPSPELAPRRTSRRCTRTARRSQWAPSHLRPGEPPVRPTSANRMAWSLFPRLYRAVGLEPIPAQHEAVEVYAAGVPRPADLKRVLARTERLIAEPRPTNSQRTPLPSSRSGSGPKVSQSPSSQRHW